MVDGDESKIKSFEDLVSWQEAIDLAAKIYKFTESFPDTEKFGLISQLRRAAASISANIAEGFGRTGQKEKVQFYSIAYGSLLEVKSFLYLSSKLGYCSKEELEEFIGPITILQKRINALLNSIRNRNGG